MKKNEKIAVIVVSIVGVVAALALNVVALSQVTEAEHKCEWRATQWGAEVCR